MKPILSDIHGNLEGLQAALADIESRGISEIVCLGDVIGYGSNPVECLELTKNSDTLILGNHEEAVLDGEGQKFNVRAKRAVDWTRTALFEREYEQEEVRQERRRHIEGFVLHADIEGIHYVHGSPRNPTREYITPRDARNRAKMAEIFECFDTVCFIGHSHVPGVFTKEGFSPPADLLNLYLLGSEKALINVGSVGQPRDGNPQASYVTFEADTVVFRRVPYDVQKAAEKIFATPGLDNGLGKRLLKGK